MENEEVREEARELIVECELMRIVKERVSNLLRNVQIADDLRAETLSLCEQIAAQMPKNFKAFLGEYRACILKRLGITDLIELFSDEEVVDDAEENEDYVVDVEPVVESNFDLGEDYDNAFTDSICAVNGIHPAFVGAYCSDGCSAKKRLARALKLNAAFEIAKDMMSICDFNRIAFSMFENDTALFDSTTPEVLACMCTYKRRMEILQAAKH
jgi:hypothetical protein